jgi:hypothetical protein
MTTRGKLKLSSGTPTHDRKSELQVQVNDIRIAQARAHHDIVVSTGRLFVSVACGDDDMRGGTRE